MLNKAWVFIVLILCAFLGQIKNILLILVLNKTRCDDVLRHQRNDVTRYNVATFYCNLDKCAFTCEKNIDTKYALFSQVVFRREKLKDEDGSSQCGYRCRFCRR